MSKLEMNQIIQRLESQKSKLWKHLLDKSVSTEFAKTLETELRRVESRIFSLRYKLLSAKN